MIGDEEFERNDFYVDNNDIMLIDIRKTIDFISNNVQRREAKLFEYNFNIKNFMKFSVFQDMENSCYDSTYKKYEVKICLFKMIEYKGFHNGRHKSKNIG